MLGSAAEGTSWPASDLPEIIMAGRSNAGKSSLINALTNRKSAAYVGKTPGKTRLLNFFEVDHDVIFCDAPGYGYAKGGSATAASFGGLLEPYFRERQNLSGMILVLDIRRVPSEDDLDMISYARESHLPVLIAAVKCDKISRGERSRQAAEIAAALDVGPLSVIPCSSVTRDGIEDLWKQIHRIASQKQP